jgi:quinol monooxygenase YgiN
MLGCIGYVVAKDTTDKNALRGAEIWVSVRSYAWSLGLPSVGNAIPQAGGIVSALDKIAITTPILEILK